MTKADSCYRHEGKLSADTEDKLLKEIAAQKIAAATLEGAPMTREEAADAAGRVQIVHCGGCDCWVEI